MGKILELANAREMPRDALSGAGLRSRLHAVALKDLLTRLTQLNPVLLQAILNSHVVAQLLTAKTFGIRRARSLFFWRTHVPL